jgi:hypothetical protein
VITVKQTECVTTLIYMLWDRIRESPATSGWPFSGERPHWLYDELDWAEDGRELLLHRILLSDGRVLEIPFLTVAIHSYSLAEAAAAIQS